MHNFMPLMDELITTTATIENVLNGIDEMDRTNHRQIFSALIQARNTLDFSLVNYVSIANCWFHLDTDASNMAAFNMIDSFIYPKADNLRDKIMDLISNSRYGTRQAILTNDPQYYHSEFNSSSHPDYPTRQKVLFRYDYLRTHCLEKVDNLSMTVNQDILSTWAEARNGK